MNLFTVEYNVNRNVVGPVELSYSLILYSTVNKFIVVVVVIAVKEEERLRCNNFNYDTIE